MNSIKLFVFIIVIQWFNHAAALNVLAIVTLPLKSHYMAFDRFFRELARRGHSVTVMNNYLEKNPPPNMTFIDLSRDRYPHIRMPPMSAYEGSNSHYMRLINIYYHFLARSQHVGQDCEHLVTSKEVVDFLAKKQKFDVIIVEQFMSDCGAAFAATLYDAPIIGITSHTLLPWSYSRLGIPFDFSSDAFYFSTGGQNPSLYHKIEAYLTNIWAQHVLQPQIFKTINSIFKRHIPTFGGDVEEAIMEKMMMMFVYQHFSVTGARLLPPQAVEIGGIHINKAKEIPKDIDTFLSSAPHGAIYVSFGSNLNASTLSTKKMKAFLDAFKKIPQKVLWKIESPNITSENVYTRPWFPQRDVLCHEKVLAFISHGGMLSLSEAAHCGKPLLTIPFFGDQFSNSATIEQSGLGKILYFDEVNADSLTNAIQYLTSKKMQDNARNIQSLWNDRPVDVLNSAIYWTEYVARHRFAPPSLPSKQSTWFEKSLLDVYSVLISIIIVVILMVLGLLSILKVLIKSGFNRYVKNKID
ncbi:unnamed protein product [Pieris brassicae]|uniref:UDP-glucuronosyltransferase n=1 Tax=Pieris brassicae TaxID=7116 RepID=A0A9P0SQD9_PIEBR|nr:unnamed protein product [Pieris brassicae]